MRTKLSISVPSSLEHFARGRVREGGYSSLSEYFRELIRLDQRIQLMENSRETYRPVPPGILPDRSRYGR